jgi:hypothetical protein
MLVSGVQIIPRRKVTIKVYAFCHTEVVNIYILQVCFNNALQAANHNARQTIMNMYTLSKLFIIMFLFITRV